MAKTTNNNGMRWRDHVKASIRRKLLRGMKPRDIKTSFSHLVDDIAASIDPQAQLNSARAEIARLRKALANLDPATGHGKKKES